MNRTERRGVVFLALSTYVGGSIVAAAVLPPPSGVARAAVFPGVAYLTAIGALAEFARIAAVGPDAMNALYAGLAYVAWSAGAYLVGLRWLGVARGELKAMALAYPGVLAVLSSVALLVGGAASGLGLVDGPLPRTASLAGAVVGAGLWLPGIVWLAKVRTTRFGWQSRALEHVDGAVETAAYVLLSVGLALVVVALALGVGPQYLALAVIGLLVVVVTVTVPTGGARESGAGYG